MTSEELDQMVQEYIDNGGEVTKLRYANNKAQRKSRRAEYHKDKAIQGNEQSKEAVERMRKHESTMIFSRVDRWKEEK